MEEFVSYEIAVKLKEKGFDKLCLLCYTNKRKLVQNSVQSTICDAICINDILNSYNRLNNGYTDVPTIAQVLKWLRKEKKISIQPCAASVELWDCQIVTITKNDSYTRMWIDDFSTYEEAALAGIEYVLDNLI